MKVKQVLIYGACSAVLFAGGVAVGQQDIDPHVHPHLAEAQRHARIQWVGAGVAGAPGLTSGPLLPQAASSSTASSSARRRKDRVGDMMGSDNDVAAV